MREAIIDANLTAARDARILIGNLAEVCQFRMVGTAEIRIEESIAVSSMHSRGLQNRTIQEDLDAIDRWREHYRDRGLWRDVSAQDYRPELATDERFRALDEMWEQYPTDPEDIHFVRDAVMCGLDAIHSVNIHMVKDEHWPTIVKALDLPHPPVLCRGTTILEWSFGEPYTPRMAENLVDMALSTMVPRPGMRTSLIDWSKRIRGPFKEIAGDLDRTLAAFTDAEMVARCRTLRSQGTAPITTEFVTSEYKP